MSKKRKSGEEEERVIVPPRTEWEKKRKKDAIRSERKQEKERKREYKRLKRASEKQGARFGRWERRQVERVLDRDFLDSFSCTDEWLGLQSYHADVPACTSITLAIRSLLTLQAAADHRSIELERFLSPVRIRPIVFAYCPSFPFDLQTLYFAATVRDPDTIHFEDVEELFDRLEQVESETSVFHSDKVAATRMIQLFQSWNDRKQQTAPLLPLMLPLHPAFRANEYGHWTGLLWSESPIERVI